MWKRFFGWGLETQPHMCEAPPMGNPAHAWTHILNEDRPMGMRCMTGEKSHTWHVVADLLKLPHPADGEVVEYLGGDALREWFRLASVVKAYFHQMTGYSVMFLDELDENGKIFDDVQSRPLVYATFMRLCGLMQADEARWVEEYERKHPVGIDDDEAWEEREAEMNEKYRFLWC